MFIDLYEKKIAQNLSEHLLIFISLIYALVVSAWLKGWQDIISLKLSYLQILWSIVLFVFIIESWWGVWNTKIKFDKKFDLFLIILIHPLILYHLTLFLFPSLYQLPSIDIKLEDTLRNFFILGGICLIYIIVEKKMVYNEYWFTKNNALRVSGALCLWFMPFISDWIKDSKADLIDYNTSIGTVNIHIGTVEIFHTGIVAFLLYLLQKFIRKFRNQQKAQEIEEDNDFKKRILPLVYKDYEFACDDDKTKKINIGFIIIKINDLDINDIYTKVESCIRPIDIISKGQNYIYVYPAVKDDEAFQKIKKNIEMLFKKLDIKKDKFNISGQCKEFEPRKNKKNEPIEILRIEQLEDCKKLIGSVFNSCLCEKVCS